MKIKEYNKFIKGYLYALNECAYGNIKELKLRCWQDYNTSFDNGIFKGVYEFERKHTQK
jgi:hypothetical protein